MIVIARARRATTLIDVRYLWYLQKRYQGSHLFNDEQASAFNDLVREGQIRPRSATYPYEETGLAHQLMADGCLPEGNVAVGSAPHSGETGAD